MDPLDGTREFILGREHYTVNISLMENDIPVLAAIAVPRKETVYFSNGITTSKSSFDLDKVTILKPKEPTEITVAVSQSHLSGKTLEYVKSMAGPGQHIRTIRAGSAVKFCMILDGLATVYPRFSPCMEWDIAAGHLLLKGVGKNIVDLNTGREMEYGKPGRLNGAFVAR